MTSDQATSIDGLSRRILRAGLVSTNSTYSGWSYKQLVADIHLMKDCATALSISLADSLRGKPDMVCAIGNSGIVLATFVSQHLSLPLVWSSKKNSLSLYPAVVSGHSLVLADSLSVTGYAANRALSEAEEAGAVVLGLAVAADFRPLIRHCGMGTLEEILTCGLLSAESHLKLIQDEMRLADDEFCQVAGRDTFWRN